MIARVQPLTRSRAVKGPFDYRLRPDQAEVAVGSLLTMPFGRRQAVGVVVALAETSELAPERLVEPESVLELSLPGDLVALGEWLAREYCSTPARALGLLLPSARPAAARSKRVLVAQLTSRGREALREGGGLRAGPSEALLALEREGPRPAAELGTALLRRLERRGLVELVPQASRRAPREHEVGSVRISSAPPPLSTDQRAAVTAVLAALPGPPRNGAPAELVQPRAARHLLLNGVTGSGKTEVYLRAVQATLAAGRTAIVLVPEIAMTPQTLQRFRARFGDAVAVLHSALPAGERHDEWWQLRRGEARVCVGPRSAVFAPLPNLGLIVVDEEHEPSYKHEGDPRYDARLVAERRAAAVGALLLSGSATPRPETALRAEELRLERRIDGRPLPVVQVLDMRGLHHPLHPQTRLALTELQVSGGKAIVLLNRRGWSNFLSCRGCGHVWMCPNCEVALILHRADGRLACHHCGHSERLPRTCPACASVSIARHGSGTERIEHELSEALGADAIFRLDADAAGLDARARVLAAFGAAANGILVGTQMIAKGHDFEDVALGVVLDADQTLRFPDFRAEERTFSLITQLAGRVGRGRDGGRVLVQTLAPEARAIELARGQDADAFLAGELERRRALGYPPFSTLIRIVLGASRAPDTLELARKLRDELAAAGVASLGPAALFALRGKARSQLVIKTAQRERAIAAVGAGVDALAGLAARRGVTLSVDVDPQ